MPDETHGIGSEVFLVGDLHVDVGQQRATRAGIKITLPNLSFQLLLALIRAAPNVLSNDLLMARVWPGLIVSPETVAKRVNLRKDGTVLVAGGRFETSFGGSSFLGSRATAMLYAPESGGFVATGSLLTERDGHTATLLVDGAVLIAGGTTYVVKCDRHGKGWFCSSSPTVLRSAELFK